MRKADAKLKDKWASSSPRNKSISAIVGKKKTLNNSIHLTSVKQSRGRDRLKLPAVQSKKFKMKQTES